ncbi:MAG: hypothetical protein ACPL88_08650, partial [Bryobacteraceae bacterium]
PPARPRRGARIHHSAMVQLPSPDRTLAGRRVAAGRHARAAILSARQPAHTPRSVALALP